MPSRKRTLLLIVLGMLSLYSLEALGQNTQTAAKPLAAYRLDFSFHELEDGKKVNTRQYSMNLVQGNDVQDMEWHELKIGTRVPVEVKQGEMQYLDVGTNISARLQEVKSALDLQVRADLTNFATPDQQQKSTMPLLRQLRISGATVVTLDKAVVIGVVDDPNSKRQFQLEVTVAKLK